MLGQVHALRLNAGVLVIPGQRRRVVRGVEPGTPDILVMLPGGRVVWLECKTERGTVTSVQHAWHARAGSMGHEVYVVRSVQDALQAIRGAA